MLGRQPVFFSNRGVSMERSSGVVIVKVGGCLLTNKRAYKTIDTATVSAIGGVLAGLLTAGVLSASRLVITLGGGSFGNAIPVKYGLYPRSPETNEADISRMSLGQLELAAVVIDSWRHAGIACQLFHLPSLINGDKESGGEWPLNLHPVRNSLRNGLIPVLTGDLILTPSGDTAIISSDRVPLLISQGIDTSRAYFLTDVDGVHSGGPQGGVISRISSGDRNGIKSSLWKSSDDLTGGMFSKLDACFDLAEQGVPSFILNGRSAKLAAAFDDRTFCGTIIEPRRHMEVAS
jgi:isopentenyl phosphate kinase